MLILEENVKQYLEAFASELFICYTYLEKISQCAEYIYHSMCAKQFTNLLSNREHLVTWFYSKFTS